MKNIFEAIQNDTFPIPISFNMDMTGSTARVVVSQGTDPVATADVTWIDRATGQGRFVLPQNMVVGLWDAEIETTYPSGILTERFKLKVLADLD